jgi:ATPase subunit of ABC transporter with duplicated ATPase domains
VKIVGWLQPMHANSSGAVSSNSPRGRWLGLEGVSLTYRSKKAEVHALDNVSLTATNQEFVALVGPSGCGKSSLLKLISGLIPQSSGVIRVKGQPISGPTASIGIVFQSPLLMAWRTVLENVLLQIEIRDLRVADYRAAARSDPARCARWFRRRASAPAVAWHEAARRSMPGAHGPAGSWARSSSICRGRAPLRRPKCRPLCNSRAMCERV